MSDLFIPVCEPFLNGNEKKYVLDAIETGWISSAGKYIPAFEKAFSEYCGVKEGIAVCNGTAALHLALVACSIGKGDEVIIPDFTMIASAFAVCYTGATPVFVDCERETWNIDPFKIEEQITSRTKAIMPVHIYGHPCEMEPIWELADKYNLIVIEDAAEVHGAEYNGKRCGSLGDIAAFSFYANKIATTGEGGMVVTNNEELASKCRYFKNLCFPLEGSRTYMHNHIGFNYRMSNIHAAIGLAQTENISKYVEARRKVHRWYAERLQGVPGITLQPERANSKNVYWMHGVIVEPKEFGMTRDELMLKLKECKIDTRLFFIGMHRQMSLRNYGCDCSGDYPITDLLSENGFYLPSSSQLIEANVDRIATVIKRAHV
jgi:perosamine synthetase